MPDAGTTATRRALTSTTTTLAQRMFQRHHMNVSGRGDRSMLFAHGFGCDQRMWRHVAPAFESDFSVVLFDHVGSGSSDVSAYDRAKYGALEGYAADVLEICSALELRRVTFVGHSVSAMIGVLAANLAPDVFDAIVMVAPSPRYINDGAYHGGFSTEEIEGMLEVLDRNYLGWSASMAPVIMGHPDRPELSAELENSFCRTQPDIARHFARVTFLSDNRSDLDQLTVPSLVIQCARDVLAPTSVGEYVHRHAANSTLAVLDTDGHCPNLSAPEATIDAIRAFLASRS